MNIIGCQCHIYVGPILMEVIEAGLYLLTSQDTGIRSCRHCHMGGACLKAAMHSAGIDKDLTFAPSINASSARLLEDSAQLPGRFLQRQRFFYDLKQQRMRILRAEVRPPAINLPPSVSARIVVSWAG